MTDIIETNPINIDAAYFMKTEANSLAFERFKRIRTARKAFNKRKVRTDSLPGLFHVRAHMLRIKINPSQVLKGSFK